MTTYKIHLSEELFSQIKELGDGKPEKVRPFITRVADIILPILTKKLGYVFADRSLYEQFKTAHDVQIPISKGNYKRLKIAHCEINTFSMGVIMRWLVKFAIDLAKKVGLNKMWRILLCQIKRFIRKKTDIQVEASLIMQKVFNETTKKTKRVPVIIVIIDFFDLSGRFQSETLKL